MKIGPSKCCFCFQSLTCAPAPSPFLAAQTHPRVDAVFVPLCFWKCFVDFPQFAVRALQWCTCFFFLCYTFFAMTAFIFASPLLQWEFMFVLHSTTVHAFVDRKTGDVYKPASWKAPAKHVRFNFCNKQDLLFLTDPRCVGWAGGYLYLR